MKNLILFRENEHTAFVCENAYKMPTHITITAPAENADAVEGEKAKEKKLSQEEIIKEEAAAEAIIEKEVKTDKEDIKTMTPEEKKKARDKILARAKEGKGLRSSAMESLWKFIAELFAGMSDEKKETEDALEEEVDDTSKLDHEAAFSMLSPNFTVTSSSRGIITKDTPPGDRTDKTNTTLTGIRTRTIKGANNLQNKLGIPLAISGATEDGHGGGLAKSGFTHGNGYKIDISFQNGAESGLENFLAQNNAKPTTKAAWDAQAKGNPDLTYTQYEVYLDGYKYKILKESDHFDICIT